MMHWTWFDLNWPWIGLGLALVLLLVLFGTNLLRNDLTVSRWFDPVWLAWLAPAAYMLHQFEEYGVDIQGTRFAFPDLLCASLGMPNYPECSVPTAFFVAVNIPAVWLAGLACALLSRRHPFVGLGLYGLHFTNALSHLGVAVTHGYNAGTLASAIINVPLSLWVAYACFFRGNMRRSGMAVLVLAGALLTAILLGSMKLFAAGYLTPTVFVMIQVFNPLCLILVPWAFEKRILKNPEWADVHQA